MVILKFVLGSTEKLDVSLSNTKLSISLSNPRVKFNLVLMLWKYEESEKEMFS